VATPVAQTSSGAPGYASVVSLMMPALPEVALSDPVLRAAQTQIPGLDDRELARRLTVQVVPGSGVARITATGGSPQEATTLLNIAVQEVNRSDLLAPVGRFRIVGDVASAATRDQLDLLFVLGTSAAAGVLVGLLTVAALQALRPRLLTATDVETALRTATSKPVPVIVADKGHGGNDVLVSRLAAAIPPRAQVVTVSANGEDDKTLSDAVTRRLRQRATRAARNGHADGGEQSQSQSPATATATATAEAPEPTFAVVTARLRRTSPDELVAAILRAEESGHRLGAVVAEAGR
jgi:hypothetical protein